MRGISDAAAVAARGNSLVLAAPPSPAYAIPVLQGALAFPTDTRARPLLLIAPEGGFGVWVAAAATAAALAGKRSAAGTTVSRASHHLTGERIDLLITTLGVATELLRRSALHLDRLSSVILVWPELELSDESFVPLFAELPKETARIIISADPTRSASLAERYAWRAPVLGPLGEGTVANTVARFPVAAVSWDGRLSALATFADLSDKDQLTVWTVDATEHRVITEQLAAHGTDVVFPADDAAVTGAVVFFDAPPPGLLDLADPIHSLLLVPPGAEAFVAHIISRPTPVSLAGTNQAGQAIGADRRIIIDRIEGGPDRGAYATLAPLFDRWTAPEVAIALQSLWLDARTKPAASARSAPAMERRPKAGKVWTSVGKKEGVTFGEWLGLLTLDLAIPKNQIGKIDTKETFTLIEFTTEANAKAAVEKLAGRTFKGRRITARVDRGRDQRPSP